MLILGIDTATPQSSVAIGGAGEVSISKIEPGAAHCETLVPAIRDLCTQCGIKLRDLEAIAIDVGPGLFTGLRVGVSTAKALGQSLGIGVVGIISLQALAFPLRNEDGEIFSAIDARRGEVFVASYQAQGSYLVPGSIAPQVLDPNQLVSLLQSQLQSRNQSQGVIKSSIRLTGDGAYRYREILEELIDGEKLKLMSAKYSHPLADSLVEIAAELLEADTVLKADTATSLSLMQNARDVQPFYVRGTDAIINWKTRDGDAPGSKVK